MRSARRLTARGMADLTEGLIKGCVKHFRQPFRILREDLSNGAGTAVRFTLAHPIPGQEGEVMESGEKFRRRAAQEQMAPKEAECLLELKSLELYHANQDRLKLAASLAEKEAKTRSILGAVSDGVITIDEAGTIHSFNLAAERIFAYEAAEIIGQKIDILLAPPTGKIEESDAVSCLDYLSAWNPEMTGMRKDGIRFPLEIGFNEVIWEQQRIIIVTARDSSDRKKAEQELRRAHEQLEARVVERTTELRASISRLTSLISNLQAGVLVEDQGGKIILINQAFCTLFGITANPDSLVGLDSDRLIQNIGDQSADPKAFYSRLIAILSSRRVVTGEEIPLICGKTFERDHVSIQTDDEDYSHLWVYRDVTERKAFTCKLRGCADARNEWF